MCAARGSLRSLQKLLWSFVSTALSCRFFLVALYVVAAAPGYIPIAPPAPTAVASVTVTTATTASAAAAAASAQQQLKKNERQQYRTICTPESRASNTYPFCVWLKESVYKPQIPIGCLILLYDQRHWKKRLVRYCPIAARLLLVRSFNKRRRRQSENSRKREILVFFFVAEANARKRDTKSYLSAQGFT